MSHLPAQTDLWCYYCGSWCADLLQLQAHYVQHTASARSNVTDLSLNRPRETASHDLSFSQDMHRNEQVRHGNISSTAHEAWAERTYPYIPKNMYVDSSIRPPIKSNIGLTNSELVSHSPKFDRDSSSLYYGHSNLGRQISNESISQHGSVGGASHYGYPLTSGNISDLRSDHTSKLAEENTCATTTTSIMRPLGLPCTPRTIPEVKNEMRNTTLPSFGMICSPDRPIQSSFSYNNEELHSNISNTSAGNSNESALSKSTSSAVPLDCSMESFAMSCNNPINPACAESISTDGSSLPSSTPEADEENDEERGLNFEAVVANNILHAVEDDKVLNLSMAHNSVCSAKSSSNDESPKIPESSTNDEDDNPLAERHICVECGEHFKKRKYLLMHQAKHNGNKKHKCPDCDKTFLYRGSMELHKKTHDALKPADCVECGISFIQRILLDEHNRVVHKIEEKAYQCDVCKKSFIRRGDFYKHLAIHKKDRIDDQLPNTVSGKSKPVKMFPCDYCGRSFNLKLKLKQHMAAHTGKKRLQCDLCATSLSSLDCLNEHKASVHGGEGTHKCDICGASYKTKYRMEDHRRIHSVETQHRCDVCNIVFPHYGALRLHMKMHTDERPFQCDLCDMGCISKVALQRHKRVHHADKSKQLSCKNCSAVFMRAKSLQKHETFYCTYNDH